MKRFKTFITEGKYPMWSKVVVGGIVVKIRSLQNQIRSEDDIKKKLSLISQQNVLLSYISGLSVAVNSRDQKLLQKIKSGSMSIGKSGCD